MWESYKFLKKINLYRSSGQVGGEFTNNESSIVTKHKELFRRFFSNERVGTFWENVGTFMLGGTEIDDKDFINSLDKYEWGLYLKSSYDFKDLTVNSSNFIMKDEKYYFPSRNVFDIIKETLLYEFPLFEIIQDTNKDHKNVLISGGIFARTALYIFGNKDMISENRIEEEGGFFKSGMERVLHENDIDIYVNYKESKKFIEALVATGSFHIIDVNNPNGYNSFLDRNKIRFRVRGFIQKKYEDFRVPIDIMITDDLPENVVGNFDMSAAQWGFDGKSIDYYGSSENKEKFFELKCSINEDYYSDVIKGSQIMKKRIIKYRNMGFFIEDIPDVIDRVSQSSITTMEFPDVIWVGRYSHTHDHFMNGSLLPEYISKEAIEQEDGTMIINGIGDVKANNYFVVNQDESFKYYYPYNIKRRFILKIIQCGFNILKKWTFVKLFLKDSQHKVMLKEFDLNLFWIELIFCVPLYGTNPSEWKLDNNNFAWFGMLRHIRQVNKISSNVRTVKHYLVEAHHYMDSFFTIDELSKKQIFTICNQLQGLYNSIFDTTLTNREYLYSVLLLYGTGWWMRQKQNRIEITQEKIYIQNTLNFWSIVDGGNTVEFAGLTWIDKPTQPDANFFFVQLSWWNRGAMKERVFYCYNHFMNINKALPWFGSDVTHKAVFNGHTWCPNLKLLDYQGCIAFFIQQDEEDGGFIIQTVDDNDKKIIEFYMDKYLPSSSRGSLIPTIDDVRYLITWKPFFNYTDTVIYEVKMAKHEKDLFVVFDKIIVESIPKTLLPEDKPIVNDERTLKKLTVKSTPFVFGNKSNDSIFDVEFSDLITFENKKVYDYLKEDFRHFIIILKGENFEDVIQTSWIDKLPNGMDDFHKSSHSYFQLDEDSPNVQKTIYRRLGSKRSLIAEDYLSRCAFGKPILYNNRNNENIGKYSYWKRAVDVEGRTYVPRGRDISHLLNDDQIELIVPQMSVPENKTIFDKDMEKLTNIHEIHFYDYVLVTDEDDEAHIWIPITEKMMNGDYSEELLSIEDRVMLVDMAVINDGTNDELVTIANPDFWHIDYPFNIFGYQSDIHSHIGASQTQDEERYSIRAEVFNYKVWDCVASIEEYFKEANFINWQDIFRKDKVAGTPLDTRASTTTSETPDTIREIRQVRENVSSRQRQLFT